MIKANDKLFLNEPNLFYGKYILTPVKVVKINGKYVYVKSKDGLTYKFVNSDNFPMTTPIMELQPTVLDNKRCLHVKDPYCYLNK